MSNQTAPEPAIDDVPRRKGGAGKNEDSKLSVAIVGGGIVGVVLAHGLLQRGIRVAIYERAPNFHEIGAGFAFTGVARECMEALSPMVIEAMKRVGVPNKRPFDEYWDGYHSNTNTKQASEPLFTRTNHELAFWGCLRGQFLDALAASLPTGITHFNKELTQYNDPLPSQGPITLYFADGTTVVADALIGCDGFRSHVRAQLLSNAAPQAIRPRYTHKRCYRTLVPLSAGESVLGSYKANNQCMHVGPGAHVLTYPVGSSLLNVVLFITDPEDWPDSRRTTLTGRREDVLSALEHWGPAVRGLAALFPPEPVVWGIFDMYDCPAPWYAEGRVSIAGDAAHASAPHHGAGAGFGVEDALAITTALEQASKTMDVVGKADKENMKVQAITAAFRAFTEVRYERTQWLVRSSREAGDIYEWQYEGSGKDVASMKRELDERFKVIWDFDVGKMVEDTRKKYHDLLGEVVLHPRNSDLS